MSNSYFTGDPHFYHANIIIYCDRPWKKEGDIVIDPVDHRARWVSKAVADTRVLKMTNEIISNFNNVLTPSDDLYILGDFAFATIEQVVDILRRLSFKKLYYVFGNHDKVMHQLYQNRHRYSICDKIVWLGHQAEVTINGQDIVLNHYAMRTWNQSHRGAWHLYGHSHGSLPDDPHARSIDVGVDCHGYMPISFQRVSELMSKKLWMPIDHHKSKEGAVNGVPGMSQKDYAEAQRRTQYLQLKKEFCCPKCGQDDAMVNGVCHHTHRVETP